MCQSTDRFSLNSSTFVPLSDVTLQSLYYLTIIINQTLNNHKRIYWETLPSLSIIWHCCDLEIKLRSPTAARTGQTKNVWPARKAEHKLHAQRKRNSQHRSFCQVAHWTTQRFESISTVCRCGTVSSDGKNEEHRKYKCVTLAQCCGGTHVVAVQNSVTTPWSISCHCHADHSYSLNNQSAATITTTTKHANELVIEKQRFSVLIITHSKQSKTV